MKTKYFYIAFLLLFYVIKSNGQSAGYCAACGSGQAVDAPICDLGYDLALQPVNFYFGNSTGGIAASEGDVIVGNVPCSFTPRAKLDVTQFNTSGGTGSIAILGENTDANTQSCSGTGPVIGVKALVDGTSSGFERIAGWFEADATSNCCAPTTSSQCAIWVPSGGGSVVIGYSYSNDVSACANIDPYLLNINGSAYDIGGWTPSDTTLKKSIKGVDKTLDLVSKLHAINFEWKETPDEASKGAHYGFIAQEVATVFPDAVRNLSGHLAMSYNDMVPLLTVAIQQEKMTNDSLRSQVKSLTQRFEQLINSGSNGVNQATGNSQDVTLSSSNSPLLYQNMPNPFSNGTKINYYLPEGTAGATIVFIDSYGNQLKTVVLNQTGNGTINVSSDNLNAGIYSYSLVVNGKVIDTKKMILQK